MAISSFVRSGTAILLVALGVCVPHASAGTFTVDVLSQHAEGSSAVDTGVVVAAVGVFQTGTFVGRAAAGPGILGARAEMTIPGVPGFSSFDTEIARASFALFDLTISGPIGGDSTITAGMHLVVDGTFVVGIPTGAVADASLQLQINVNGQREVSQLVVGSDPVANGLFGGVRGATINQNFLTSPFTFATHGPNSLSVQMDLGAFADGNGISGQVTSAFAEFGHTISFPSRGPVFELPEGYTANSISGQIVDNRWVGGQSSPVPEPSALVMSSILLGMFGVVWSYKRLSK